jgi:hypothetical protein
MAAPVLHTTDGSGPTHPLAGMFQDLKLALTAYNS